MSDAKMLQAILDKVSSVDKKVDVLEDKMVGGFKKVEKRLDGIGASVARLEDDTPTIREFGSLEKRVGRLEKLAASS